MKSELRYIQYPVFMHSNLLGDTDNIRNTLNLMIDYGIYRFGDAMKFKINDVALQIYYHFHRGRLPEPILDFIASNEFEYIYSDFEGFELIEEIEAVEQIPELIHFFELDENFKIDCVDFHRTYNSQKLSKVKGSIMTTISKGRLVKNSLIEGEVFSMANVNTLINFRDQEKSRFEIEQFICYQGIRSIFGTKEFCKTNKRHILMRMIGFKSVKEFSNPSIFQKELLDKYSKRYHFDKLMRALEQHWGIIYYSRNIRGMYISIQSKMNLKKLVKIAEFNKQKSKDLVLKIKKNKVIQEAKYEAYQEMVINNTMNRKWN